MSRSRYAAVLLSLFALGACGRSGPDVQAPPEPYRMVYTMANTEEVTLLDLNSVKKTGDKAEIWSLTLLSEPFQLEGAPKAVEMFWTRSELDCAAQTGRSNLAIGLENGEPAFTVPVDAEPSAMADAWPLDQEFVCQDLQGARTAATTLIEAVMAARNIMNPQQNAAGAAPAPAPAP